MSNEFFDIPEDSLSEEENAKRMIAIPPRTVIPLLCGLRFNTKIQQAQQYEVAPQIMFRVQGMMLWGVSEDTWIEGVTIGNRLQSEVACIGIPAMFFATARSYDHLVEELKKNGIAPPSWIRWDTCMIGQRIIIRVKGPIKSGILWGEGFRG